MYFLKRLIHLSAVNADLDNSAMEARLFTTAAPVFSYFLFHLSHSDMLTFISIIYGFDRMDSGLVVSDAFLIDR